MSSIGIKSTKTIIDSAKKIATKKTYVNLHGVKPMDELIPTKQGKTPPSPEPEPGTQTGGCNGSIATVGSMLGLLAIMSLIFACAKKKESEV